MHSQSLRGHLHQEEEFADVRRCSARLPCSGALMIPHNNIEKNVAFLPLSDSAAKPGMITPKDVK